MNVVVSVIFVTYSPVDFLFVHLQVAVAVLASKAVWFNESARHFFDDDRKYRSSTAACIEEEENLSIEGERHAEESKKNENKEEKSLDIPCSRLPDSPTSAVGHTT